MARVLRVDRAEVAPGQRTFGRFRLEAPVTTLPGDRYVVRSYSPIITIGGGTVLDVVPPRCKRKGGALAEHLRLLETASPAQVVEEHLRQAGPAGLRAADLRAGCPSGPSGSASSSMSCSGPRPSRRWIESGTSITRRAIASAPRP